MFVFRQIRQRAADGLDLAIEFSTLGEYGFLPDPGAAGARSAGLCCGNPGRGAATGTPRRSESRSDPRRTECHELLKLAHQKSGGHRYRPGRADDSIPRVDLSGALRPPRIETDWAA